MNILDLPEDVLKIIGRKCKDIHIARRRLEQKQNRQLNIEQKIRCNQRKQNLFNWRLLYYKIIENIKIQQQSIKVNQHYTYLKNLQQKVENSMLKMFITEIIPVIGGDKPYLEVYLKNPNTNQINKINILE